MAHLQRQGTDQVEVLGRQGEAILHQMSDQLIAVQQENVGTFQREMERKVTDMQRSFHKYAVHMTEKIAEVRLLSSTTFSS